MNRYPVFFSPFRSFTLLELLVSISILCGVMVLLFEIFHSATVAWSSSERKADAFREARAALHIMSRDLRSAVITPQTLMSINQNWTDLSTGSLTANLFFISAQPAHAQSGNDHSDLCAIGYYVAYGETTSGGEPVRSFNLHRYFQGSNQLFSNLLGSLAAIDLTQLFYPPPKAGPAGDEILARNICNLEFKWTTNALAPLTNEAAFLNCPSPLQIEIALDALNYDTARKLVTQEDWHHPPSPLQRANRQHFTTRVTVGPESSDFSDD